MLEGGCRLTAPTQYRTFNYTTGTVVGGDLLSATNPENGTVTYTYNGTHTLATKVDAKGVHFAYTYDSLNRMLTVSAAGNTLRTYTYETNSIDSSYSHNLNGRLATIEYPAINYDVAFGGPQGSTKFTEMFDYSAPGQVVGKRLRVDKVQPYPNGTFNTQTGRGNLNMTYAYNVEGKLTSVTYPTDAATSTTPQYTTSYDSMMRPAGLTDVSSTTLVSGVTYGPANELTQMIYNGGTETRTYNSRLQLTHLSMPGQIDITYTFPTANNGKIVSQTDNLSAETVTYQYDSLNRLTQATGSTPSVPPAAWSQTYSYDGFGNLTNRGGTGAALGTNPTPADPTTNRLTGAGYDANGNMTSTGNLYDAENRLSQANMPGGVMQYFYNGNNKRIWQAPMTNCSSDWCLAVNSDSVSMFGIDGKLVGTYTPTASWSNTPTPTPLPIAFTAGAQRVYFAGKLIKQGHNQSVIQDRLGSVGRYYPFGEDRAGAPNDQVKFATYTRDSATGNDYADQRYYSSQMGRFATPDPYRGSSNPSEPGSWNRYNYVLGDPVNFVDPAGLDVTPIRLTLGTKPTCLDDFFTDVMGSPHGSVDLTSFLNSDVGTLAIQVYFEWQDQDTPGAEATWLAIANVERNRWHLSNSNKKRYGFTTAGFKQLIYQSAGPKWNQPGSAQAAESHWDPNGILKSGLRSQLINILNSSPDNGLCKGLIKSFEISEQVYNNHAPDPTSGALFYRSVRSSSPVVPPINPFGFVVNPILTENIGPIVSAGGISASFFFYRPGN